MTFINGQKGTHINRVFMFNVFLRSYMCLAHRGIQTAYIRIH